MTHPVGPDQLLHPWGQTPVGADDPVAPQDAPVDAPLHDIGGQHGGVVRVGVLLPLALDDRLPAVVEHVLARPDLHGEEKESRDERSRQAQGDETTETDLPFAKATPKGIWTKSRGKEFVVFLMGLLM